MDRLQIFGFVIMRQSTYGRNLELAVDDGRAIGRIEHRYGTDLDTGAPLQTVLPAKRGAIQHLPGRRGGHLTLVHSVDHPHAS